MSRKGLMFISEVLILFCISLQYELLVAFLCIFFHELSHGLVALIFGMDIKYLLIHPLGFFIEIEKLEEFSDEKQLGVYFAGPIFNLILALVFLILFDKQEVSMYKELFTINITLCLLNLLPVFPLDGGRIFNIILSRKLTYRAATKMIVYSSFVIGTGFGILFLYSLLLLHKVNLTFLMISFLVIYSAYKENGRIMYILMGDVIKKKSKFNKQKYIENRSISVYYKLGLINLLTMIDKNKFHSFCVLDDNMKMLGILYEDELMEALKLYGNITLEEYLEIKEHT